MGTFLEQIKSGDRRWPLRLMVAGAALILVTILFSFIAEPPTYAGRHPTSAEMVDWLLRGTSSQKQWVRDVAAGKYNSWDDEVHNFLVRARAFWIGLILIVVGVVLERRRRGKAEAVPPRTDLA